MKIALLSPISFPLPPISYAPWEKVVHSLAQGLHSSGQEVTVFAAADSSAEYKIIPTVECSLNKLHGNTHEYEMLHIAKACQLISRGDFDIVNNHINWSGHLPLRNTGVTFVTTVHGFDDSSRFVFSNLKDDNYISISYSLRKQLPELNYVGNVYNGIDFRKFTMAEKKEDFFFTAARICPEKGIHHAISLAKETNTKLYIAGVITDEDYFKEKVEPEINNLNIIYLGNLTQEVVHDYVSRAKAYISLIEFDEPFGLSVAEAIACGTPVIGTKRGAMSELIREGITGILVNDVEEAVRRIFEIARIDPELCRQFGMSMFSIDRMVEDYIDIYRSLL